MILDGSIKFNQYAFLDGMMVKWLEVTQDSNERI